MDTYSQNLKVRHFPIETGVLVAVLHEIDAKELGVWFNERIRVHAMASGKEITCVVDITNSMVSENEIGLFVDTQKALQSKDGEPVRVQACEKPKSVEFIRKKMNNETLSADEIKTIIHDITENNLSDIEASAFVSAVYMRGLDLSESVALTKALVSHGRTLTLRKSPVVDKHSVGGTNGRATMICIPILASAGLYVPKTSSRSITSAAGTADCMEVLANVKLSLEQIREITERVGGVIAWGGAVDLAPADDKIIKIEHPLKLDPEGQVIASVMAKKASVGAKFVVIDIPVGPTVKVKSREQAERMATKFIAVGKELGMKVEVVLTNGLEPSGRYFGPALESKGALEILENKYFDNLAQKSCEMAGAMFELVERAPKGHGTDLAKQILRSGAALAKFKEIMKAQGGTIMESTQITPAPHTRVFKAEDEGQIEVFNMSHLTQMARLAGAPGDKKAGLVLHVAPHDRVTPGQTLFEIHAENPRKLELAVAFANENPAFKLEKIILEKFT